MTKIIFINNHCCQCCFLPSKATEVPLVTTTSEVTTTTSDVATTTSLEGGNRTTTMKPETTLSPVIMINDDDYNFMLISYGVVMG